MLSNFGSRAEILMVFW